MLFLVLRSVVDFFYVAAYMRNCGRRNSSDTSWFIQLFRFIGAVDVTLPIPQVVLLSNGAFSVLSSVNLILLLAQYVLRISHIYEWVKHINIDTRIGRLVKGVLDFCPFILTAHLFGAMWYFLAIKRETRCWLKACQNVEGCHPATDRDFSCGRNGFKVKDITIVNRLCPTNPSNASALDFGIYLDVIKFGTTRTTNCGPKLLQCFSWGLRNLSSLGSNLEPSKHVWDNIFAISISISGIILFLVYLNENLQTYRQLAKKVSKKLKFNQKMQKISPDIDLWLSKNADVPKDMKTVIMKTVRYRVEENKDVDVENIVYILSPVHKRLIMRPLCLDLLKKVPLLEHMDVQVLKAISEHLNWVFYAVESYIIREGEPLGKMFFIRQGTAWTYATRTDHISGGSTSGSSIIDNLEKDDLYGAELLEWAFSFGSFSNLPISTRTVVSQERVEAFVIRAKDLKKIVSMFWWQFSRKLQLHDIEDSLLRQLKYLAISSLLRHRKAMAKRGTGWDKVYSKLIKSD
ncbi:probable cyclic nucleotide-gated ion channel 10 isoform X2 [Rosa chinensis]|nr:probable cyclic nucleotide-gated ion channel 10 isoform X2 [Rosa chinensis]